MNYASQETAIIFWSSVRVLQMKECGLPKLSIIVQGNQQSCWTKPNNCNVDMWSLDAGGYDGPTCSNASTWLRANCVHGGDGSLNHITNHSIIHLACNASSSVWAYHSKPFTAIWFVRKTSIASSSLDTEQQTPLPPMVRWKKDVEGRMEWNCFYWRLKLLSATPRWSNTSLETAWREDPGQLHYAPPHWSCTGYYDMRRYWISLSHSSSMHCRYFKQPALHLRNVGASCPSLHLGLAHSYISTG